MVFTLYRMLWLLITQIVYALEKKVMKRRIKESLRSRKKFINLAHVQLKIRCVVQFLGIIPSGTRSYSSWQVAGGRLQVAGGRQTKCR